MVEELMDKALEAKLTNAVSSMETATNSEIWSSGNKGEMGVTVNQAELKEQDLGHILEEELAKKVPDKLEFFSIKDSMEIVLGPTI